MLPGIKRPSLFQKSRSGIEAFVVAHVMKGLARMKTALTNRVVLTSVAVLVAFIGVLVTDSGNRRAEASHSGGTTVFAIIPLNTTGFPELIGQVDLGTGAITNRFPAPANGNGAAAGIAFDGTTIYYSSGFSGNRTVYRLTSSGALIGTFQAQLPLTTGLMEGLEFRNGSLFTSRGTTLFELDPNTGVLKNSFSGVVPGIWTLGDSGESYRAVNLTTLGRAIQVFDITTGTKLREFPTPGGGPAIALGWDQGDLVVWEFPNLLSRMDPTTKTVFSSTAIQFGPKESFFTGLSSARVLAGAVQADLSLAMSDTPDPVLVGSNVTYSASVTNNGPSLATGVTMTDMLPTSASLVSASPGCNEVAGTVTCNVGNLASGNTVSVTVIVNVTTAGTITNTAQVAGAEADPDPTNNMATESTTVQTPQQATQDLTIVVDNLVSAGVLNQGQGGSLTAKLNAAINQLNKGNVNSASNQLQAFINHVDALINGGVHTPGEGQPLIDAATAILSAL